MSKKEALMSIFSGSTVPFLVALVVLYGQVDANNKIYIAEMEKNRVNQEKFNQEYVLGMSKLLQQKSVKDAELIIDLSKERRAIIEATKP